MKLWIKIYQEHKIINQAVQEYNSARPASVNGWAVLVAASCKPLDLACPIVLNKHLQELKRFSRTVFYPADFMEAVDFDRVEIEIFPEKSVNQDHTVS